MFYSIPKIACRNLRVAVLGGVTAWAIIFIVQAANGGQSTNEIKILELQGNVQVSLAGTTSWSPARTNQALHPSDHLRTGANSRAALYWPDQSIIPVEASTELEILPPDSPDSGSGLHLIRGVISFFHRDQPGHIRVITRGAVAGVEGTEFVVGVDAADETTLSVIDGRVRFGNEYAMLVLTNGQQAVAELGRAPVRTAGFVANNILQWCFYYPAVFDLHDLPLTPDEEEILRDSLTAYRSGDLLVALANYPAGRQPASGAERIYLAALLLSVGQVGETETRLGTMTAEDSSGRLQRLATALRQLIAAVKRQPNPSNQQPELATEFLAQSYFEQSRAVGEASLEIALHLARQATTNSPTSGFAWERVAELEFSFGRTSAAINALEKSLSLSPRNAQALALKGFLLAAQNKTRDAITWFERALAVDSALGNAWLGRGLCRIHLGDNDGGREDLLVAAALEPQRSALRSYLGKAYANTGDATRAAKEFQLAERLDPDDPTAWLYSALLNQQRNRINEAIGDLEKSQALNDNRRLYRSQFLLDQDRAVRSANLARIYQDAGMFDVSVREAVRAVNDDYANYSAHLFLADSYASLIDPNEVDVRYETPAHNEYLLANLLAPPSAGTLSPTISQQEYSKLFEGNRFGGASSTEYLSRGAWTQSASQFGIMGNFSYDLEAFYHFDPGQRANNDIEQRAFSVAFKQQLTLQDSIYFQAQFYEARNGDVSQHYDPSMANPHVRQHETQEPIINLGYHHEWSPNVHTLFLFSRIDDTATVINPKAPTLVTFRPDIDPDTMPGVTELTSVYAITMNERLVSRFEIYSGELQQIWQQTKHTTVVGGRFQYGEFRISNFQNQPSTLGGAFPPPPSPAIEQHISSVFQRVNFYGYHRWQIFEPLELIGGLAYDQIVFPENFRNAPVSSKEKRIAGLLPKAGFIWTPAKETTVRFAYTRSLAGATLDQSLQMEPSQVAGFVQSYRNIIPGSVAGGNAGAEFETYGISVEQKFKSRTYVGLSGEILNSKVRKVTGAFDVLPDEFDYAVASGLREHLDYQEHSLQLTANQLLGKDWALGAQYRCSWADLKDNFVDVPDGLLYGNFQPRQRWQGVLQQLDLFAIVNHSTGFYSKGEALWRAQSNSGYSPAQPGDDFWQFNALVGYRSPRRRMELSIALLNITGQDYKLNPLNVYQELPRDRTLAVRLQFNF